MMWLVDHIGLGRTTTRVDKSYLIFNDFHELPIHQESEIIVPYSDTVELVRIIRDVVLANNFPVNYITEVYMHVIPPNVRPWTSIIWHFRLSRLAQVTC